MKNLKLYIFITIVITLWSQASCRSGDETKPEPPRVSSESIASAIANAQALFKQREDVTKLREAIDVLATMRDLRHPNFEIEWKFAKYNYFLGKQTTDEKEAEAAFDKGRDTGKIAARLEPEKADGHFWYGANLGELARINPITVGFNSVDEIRTTMNKVIELQPDYQNTSAYDALAQIEMGTRITGGSPQKAVEYLEKALETEKVNMNLHLHLAEAYLAVKKPAEARKQLDLMFKIKADPDYIPEYKDCVQKGKKMLETRF